MKGVVFNLLERVVVNKYGETVWDQLLDATKLSGVYTTLGSYPDEEIEQLVGAASAALNIPGPDVLRWFGRQAMPLLAQQYPVFFSSHQNAGPFIMSVNAIIHPEVRKLYTGAGCPHFNFDKADDGSFLMGYNSPAQTLRPGAWLYGRRGRPLWQHRAGGTSPRCMHKGDSNCVMSVRVH